MAHAWSFGTGKRCKKTFLNNFNIIYRGYKE